METVDRKYILPTKIIDSDHEAVLAYAGDCIAGTDDPVEKAIRLYYAVRDRIWYDPYYPFYRPENYRASKVLKSGRGYCVSKAALLCALGRACRIPSRVGFADVKNHLATRQLVERMGSDLFVYHGFTEFFLEGKWVKATPAFNIELCQRHQVAPLEFNGREDSVFHAFNSQQKPFMEYVGEHGSYVDIPVAAILAAWRQAYGKQRVESWIRELERAKGTSDHDFFEEEIICR